MMAIGDRFRCQERANQETSGRLGKSSSSTKKPQATTDITIVAHPRKAMDLSV